MHKIERILWSIPPVLFVLQLAFYIFPVALNDYYMWFYDNGWFDKLIIILLIEYFYLVLNIWKKKSGKFEKWDWTLRLLFVFPPLSFLYYIWKKEAVFEKGN